MKLIRKYEFYSNTSILTLIVNSDTNVDLPSSNSPSRLRACVVKYDVNEFEMRHSVQLFDTEDRSWMDKKFWTGTKAENSGMFTWQYHITSSSICAVFFFSAWWLRLREAIFLLLSLTCSCSSRMCLSCSFFSFSMWDTMERRRSTSASALANFSAPCVT